MLLRRWGAQDAFCWLELQQQGWTDGSRLSFAVLDSERGNAPDGLLGNVALKGWKAGSDAAEVGYWTAATARNRGIASHALPSLLPGISMPGIESRTVASRFSMVRSERGRLVGSR